MRNKLSLTSQMKNVLHYLSEYGDMTENDWCSIVKITVLYVSLFMQCRTRNYGRKNPIAKRFHMDLNM